MAEMKSQDDLSNITLEVKQELTEILYKNLFIGLLGLVVMSTILFWQLYDVINVYHLLIWYMLLNLNLICGFFIIWWYQHTKNQARLQAAHYYWYLAGSSLTALLLGVIGSVLMPADIQHQAIVMIIVLGVVGAAVQSLHASYLASANYLVLSLLPLLMWQTTQIVQGRMIYVGIFIATLTYFLYLAVDVRSGYVTLVKNIQLKIENINYANKLNLQNFMMETVSTVAYYLQRCVSEKEIYLVFSRYIHNIFPEYAGALSVYVESRMKLKNVVTWGELKSKQDTLFSSRECWALRTKQSTFFSLQNQDFGCSHCQLDQKQYGSLCIPMMAGEEMLGVLSFIFSEQPPTPEQKETMNRLAGDVALSLANVRMNKYLQELSTHDPLTGLFNRRYLEETINNLTEKAKHENFSFSIIMYDIDRFKQLNDTFGHDAGDVVLKQLGQYMRAFFKETQLCFRYGGEELIVILISTQTALAKQKADEFRLAVKNLHFDEYPALRITISGGVLTYPTQAKTVEDCFTGVDKALYKAKNEGRDRICVAEYETSK